MDPVYPQSRRESSYTWTKSLCHGRNIATAWTKNLLLAYMVEEVEEKGKSRTSLVQLGMDVREVIVSCGVQSHARGFGFETQDRVNILFLYVCA